MAQTKNVNTSLDKIVSLAKRRGFVFQSSEIYGGLNGAWDYGPLGVELLRNVKDEWWKTMTLREDVEGVDAAILMHPRVWEASGHVENFTDPMVDCKQCKARYRVDLLLEGFSHKNLVKLFEFFFVQQLEARKKMMPDEWIDGITKVYKEIPELRDKSPIELRDLDDAFLLSSVKILKPEEWTDDKLRDWLGLPYVFTFISDHGGVACPNCGNKGTLTSPRQFNLMFKTFVGPVEDSSSVVFLRPETAQGIFVNFQNVMTASRQRLPFGIAQIGKAFRNEINTKNFLFRTREFEQMEMQFFVKPGTDDNWFEYWREQRMQWYINLGMRKEELRWHQHPKEKLAHYAKDAYDIEFRFPFGWGEIEGVHNRTNFDLSRHEEYSGKSLKYFDEESKEKYTPFVIETSCGASRSFMAFLTEAYNEEEAPTAEGGSETRVVLKFHPRLAPIKTAIFPLVNRDGMQELAHNIETDLRSQLRVFYDDSGAVGRRYRRQDEIGTPYCVTVDSQTLQDQTVTVRDRDSMVQERVSAGQLSHYLHDKLKWQKQ